MAYDAKSYQAVIALLGTGLSDDKIAAQTGVKGGTVRNWRLRCHTPRTVVREALAAEWSVPDAPSYCYLLGAYLGDGTVNVQKGTWLQIVNDRRYPGITKEILDAMATTFPAGVLASIHPRAANRTSCVSAIPRCSERCRSTGRGVSTCAPSFSPTGNSTSPVFIRDGC